MSDHRAQQQAACFEAVYQPAGRYINDHCLVRGHDGVFHLFHIVGPAGRRCYDPDTALSFGHATSRDLAQWQAETDILSIDPASEYEPHHIFAPYVCQKDGKYWLFYAGINQTLQMESMCVACSDDLFNWTKHPSNPIFRPSSAWAEYEPGSGVWACCRDPHVLVHPTHDYIVYYVTWIKGTNGDIVALGAAASNDLQTWQDAGPIIVRPRADGCSTISMESPCVVGRDGRYHLFYKHHNETRHAVSDDPVKFSDQVDQWFSIAHAAEVFPANGQWYISSCSRQLLDLRHESSDRTKGLYLACLAWGASGPTVESFTALNDP